MPSPPPPSTSTPTRSGPRSPSPEPLGTGPATLHLAFTGILNDKLHGFYRRTFTDDAGGEHVIATTQFEATDARRAFPCLDEPDRKAVFAVTLVVADGLAAFSNGPVVEETPEPGGQAAGPLRRHHGRCRPTWWPSSSGPLEATEPVDVDGVPAADRPPRRARAT